MKPKTTDLLRKIAVRTLLGTPKFNGLEANVEKSITNYSMTGPPFQQRHLVSILTALLLGIPPTTQTNIDL